MERRVGAYFVWLAGVWNWLCFDFVLTTLEGGRWLRRVRGCV